MSVKLIFICFTYYFLNDIIIVNLGENMKKVLIFGAAGNIGLELIKYLLSEGKLYRNIKNL